MSEIEFLNIDLDIESHHNIDSIVAEWGSRVSVQRLDEADGVFHGSFETGCIGINEIIQEYHTLVMSLSTASKRLWDEAGKKQIDVGFQCGSSPNSFHEFISTDSVAKLAEIGVCMTLTLYPDME